MSCNAGTCGRAAREGNGGNVRMGHHGLTHFRPEAVKDIEHPVGKPCLLDPCAQQIGRHGSKLGGLGHHTVACGKRGGHLPGEQVQGQIPWADARHHPQSFAQRVVDRLAFHGMAFTGIMLNP